MSLKYYNNNTLNDVTDMLMKTTGSEYYQEVDCTAAEYALIDPHDPHTIYVVTQPDQTVVKYLGDEEIGYDKYYTIERAAIVKEEDAETMIVEHEVVNVDVVSGTTAIYGNARNKFIAGGHRVIMARSDAQAANSLAREDLYGAGISFANNAHMIQSATISSINIVTNNLGELVKRYTVSLNIYDRLFSTQIDIPSDNVLSTFGAVYKVSSISQTALKCAGVVCIGAIDNEGNKYVISPPSSLNGYWVYTEDINMSTSELNFAFGMIERYEVIDS